MSTISVTLGTPVPFTPNSDANIVAVGTTFVSDGAWVTSQNEEYVLILQPDGNLVLYQVIGNPPPFKPGVSFMGQALWAAGTFDNKGDTFVVQADGNLVVYNSDGNPIWASNTEGIVPIGLFVQNDGNLVLYKQAPAWASNTNSDNATMAAT